MQSDAIKVESRVKWLTTACVVQVVCLIVPRRIVNVNSGQARPGRVPCWEGRKAGRCRRLSVGRIDGPCLVCYNHSGTAESCGRQLIPIPRGAHSAFLLALYTTTEHNDLDHFVVKCFKPLVFYLEHRQYPVPDCNPHAHTLSQIQW
jgi:hypothetical protein